MCLEQWGPLAEAWRNPHGRDGTCCVMATHQEGGPALHPQKTLFFTQTRELQGS